MSTEDLRTIATTYFEAWRAGDVERLRSILSDGVTFRGPLGAADGADECLEGLGRMAQMITDLRIQKIAVDGPDVLTWFDLHTEAAPPIPVVNWSTTRTV